MIIKVNLLNNIFRKKCPRDASFFGNNEADKGSQCCKVQRGKTALCGMHIQTPCTVGVKEREGKMREEVHLNIPGKPFGFYIRMNSERTRCELLILGKNFLVSV